MSTTRRARTVWPTSLILISRVSPHIESTNAAKYAQVEKKMIESLELTAVFARLTEYRNHMTVIRSFNVDQ